jgi:hypothetical protein
MIALVKVSFHLIIEVTMEIKVLRGSFLGILITASLYTTEAISTDCQESAQLRDQYCNVISEIQKEVSTTEEQVNSSPLNSNELSNILVKLWQKVPHWQSTLMTFHRPGDLSRPASENIWSQVMALSITIGAATWERNVGNTEIPPLSRGDVLGVLSQFKQSLDSLSRKVPVTIPTHGQDSAKSLNSLEPQ